MQSNASWSGSRPYIGMLSCGIMNRPNGLGVRLLRTSAKTASRQQQAPTLPQHPSPRTKARCSDAHRRYGRNQSATAESTEPPFCAAIRPLPYSGDYGQLTSPLPNQADAAFFFRKSLKHRPPLAGERGNDCVVSSNARPRKQNRTMSLLRCRNGREVHGRGSDFGSRHKVKETQR